MLEYISPPRRGRKKYQPMSFRPGKKYDKGDDKKEEIVKIPGERQKIKIK
jgi:hypothetical protein